MKNGITLSVIVIAVTIMFIVISSATVIGTAAINAANYEEFMSKLSRVSDEVNKYKLDNKELPVSSFEVVSKEMIVEGFANKLVENGDNMNTLYIVDMSKLKLTSVNIGSGSIEDRDVFLVAENTDNIYYYKGFKYKYKWYYGL